MSSDPSSLPIPPASVGALLRIAWADLIDQVFRELADAGFTDLRPVHQPILRDLLTAGQRPTELAARLGLSKQSVNDMLRELERLGYITLVPDPEDGRAKRTQVTERGWQLGVEAARRGNEIGQRWAALVGEERYAIFEEVLREIVAGISARKTG
jgi:DNA-binding MarR family transcriptional regulator